MPGRVYKVDIKTPISDVAGNILSPVVLGGKYNTVASGSTIEKPGNITSSFKTIERPMVKGNSPADGAEGVLLNINPTITFKTLTTSFRDGTAKYPLRYGNSQHAEYERLSHINSDAGVVKTIAEEQAK